MDGQLHAPTTLRPRRVSLVQIENEVEWAQCWHGLFGQEKNLLTLPEIYPKFLDVHP
jgi:hypothetical protein